MSFNVTVDWTNFLAATHAELRPYQEDILDQVATRVAAGQRFFSVTIPTGAGKSWLIGLMPVKLQLVPALCLCPWQKINESNAAFYSSPHFEMAGENDAVGRVSTADNNCDLKYAGIDFAGVTKMLKTAARVGRYRLVQIDEIQDVSERDFAKIKEHLAPDTVLIVYSAMPPKAVYDDPTFHRIEVTLASVCGFVKLPKIMVVSSEGVNVAARQKVIQTAAKCRANPTKTKTTAVRNELNQYCRSALVFARVFRVAMDERIAMESDGANPGILVQCRSVLECKHWQVIVQALEPALVTASITDTTSKRDVEAALRGYENNTVDVLFVVKMLGVGWHKSRTSIVVPVGAESGFSSRLQLFGRAFSNSQEIETSVLVVPDVHEEVGRFCEMFQRYMFHGVRALYGPSEADIVDVDSGTDTSE